MPLFIRRVSVYAPINVTALTLHEPWKLFVNLKQRSLVCDTTPSCVGDPLFKS
jgi:hypothetical protein